MMRAERGGSRYSGCLMRTADARARTRFRALSGRRGTTGCRQRVGEGRQGRRRKVLCVQQHPYVRVIGSLAFFFSRVTVGDMSARRYPAGVGGQLRGGGGG